MKEIRKTIKIDTESNKTLTFLYNNMFGRCMLKVLTMPFISNIVGWYFNTPLSKFRINRFVKNNNIEMAKYEGAPYRSFNDFFTRKQKTEYININSNKNSLISPSDSKLTVYKIDNDNHFNIKNCSYTISELLKDDALASKYKNGYALIFRLCVDDYHRYCFIDSGSVISSKKINGILHTVQPIATMSTKVYKTNSREYTVLKTDNFGDVVQIEVGAMIVGRIKNTDKKHFTKGQEKGFFEFGGSTIVLLLEENKVKIDQDILENTSKDLETIVKYGEKIGEKIDE